MGDDDPLDRLDPDVMDQAAAPGHRHRGHRTYTVDGEVKDHTSGTRRATG